MIDLCSAFSCLLTSTRVIFRGILSCLCPLYENLLLLLREVASSQPMPYLIDTVLPECVADFLGPSDVLTLTIKAPSASPRDKVCQPPQKKARIIIQNKTRKQEDLGIAIERSMEIIFILCLLQY